MSGIGDSIHENLVSKQLLAGAIAGGLADGMMYPMMTVKSRLQVQAIAILISVFFHTPSL